MGIRFYCPACGKRLNVKAFLAGKRGVCPECGSGVDIPLESKLEKGAPKIDPNFAPSVPTSPAGDSAPSPVLKPPRGQTAAKLKPRPKPLSASPAPATSGVAVPTQRSLSVPTAGASQQQPAAVVSAPAVAAPVDPIAEAPNASWYVRPSSGGEYGPAPPETMRKWLNEGRVGPNALVWRVGWDDWRMAGTVFSSLGGAPVPPASAVAANAAVGTPVGGSTARYRASSRNSTALAITVVVVLGLMSIGLLITLILILMSTS